MIEIKLERNEGEPNKGKLWLVHYMYSTVANQVLLAEVVQDPQTSVLGLTSVHPILGQYVVFNNSLPPKEMLTMQRWEDVKVLAERLERYLKDLATTLWSSVTT